MPLYRISGPDGNLYEIEGPAGATRTQVIDAVQQQLSTQNAPQRAPTLPEPKAAQKEGFFPGLKEGAIGATEATIRGAKAPFIPEEQIRREYDQQKAEAAQRNVAHTPFAAIPEAYEKEGIGAALSTTYKASRDALSGSLPYMAPTIAGAATGARLGAMASPYLGPAAPAAPIVGGLIGGIAASIPQFAGTNIERRIEAKTPGPLVTPEVYTTAAGQASLDTAATMFTLGAGLVAKTLGRPVAQISDQQLLRTAERSLTGTVGRGAVRGAVSEIPTEVAQQILERRQAGLDLTSEDAYREYGEVAAAAGVLGGALGGAGNVVTRGQARNTIETQDQLRESELAGIQSERDRIAGIARTAQAQAAARQQAEQEALAAQETVAEVTPSLDEPTIKSFGFKKNSLAYKALEALNNPEMSPAEQTQRFDQIIENNQSKIKTKEQEEAVTKFKQFMAQQLEKERVDELRTVDSGAVGESADLFGGPDTTELSGRTGEPVGLGMDGARDDVRATEIGTDEVTAPLAEAKPNYADMSYEELDRLAQDAGSINENLDIEAVRKHFGEEEAAKFAKMNKRQQDKWWEQNATEEFERDSSAFKGIDDDEIADYRKAVNDFDIESAWDLGKSIAVRAKDFNKPDFIGSPAYTSVRNALKYAQENNMDMNEVREGMIARAGEWGGNNAYELFKDLFKKTPQQNQSTVREQPAQIMAPRMTVEARQQLLAEQRAEEAAARKAEKEANLAQAKAEQGGFREAEVMPEAEREGLQAAQEFEQAEASYENAKNTAGAFIRQTFGGAENIAPEERVTLPQFLTALADIMYHIVRRGVTNKVQAIQQARDELGDNVNDFQLNKAFAEAKKRIDAEDKIKEAPPPTKAEEQAAPVQQRELREETTGDNIFRDLVSPRVKDARLNLGAAIRAITPKLLSMYQLVDQFGAEMPALQQYSELNDKMTMTQQRLKNKAHSLLSEWGAFSFKNPVMHKKLGKLMLDATRSRIHPDEEIGSEANAHLTEDMVDKYEELSNAYNALSPEAKQIYQRARALLQENFNLRRTTYNDMVRGAYAEDLAEATPEETKKINDRIEKAIQEHELLLNEMRGPYFPLMRFGEYLVVAESDELRELREELADAVGPERKRLIEMLRQMEQSDDHYQVHAFDKRSEQAREAERLKRTGLNIRETKSEDYMSNIRANSFGAIDQLEKIFDREIDLEVDPAQMRQLRQAMIDSVLAGLPENSALQRQIKRRNVAGATENMLQAFAETMERDSHYLSRMGYMKPLSKSLIDMRNQSKNDMQLRDVYNNVRARMNLDMRYDHHPILSKLTGISSIYHLGIAPSYLLQNMTQPFMITVPQLAGRYGAAKTSRAVIGAWKDASKAVKGGRNGKFFSLKDTDLSNAFSGGELKMVQMLQDLGKLDIANNMDTEVYTKGMSPKMIKFWNMFNWSSHNIELMNRLSSALAAYRLEKGKGSSDEGASKAARDAVELTQLDYSDTNAAYFMKQGHMGGMNRIPMQFRKYQQGMVYLLARNFKNAWGGDKEAKKAFFYLMGTQLLMAGVRGVPVAAPLLFLMGAFGDDDDKDGDLETQLRNALADSVGPETARVFWKGLPAMLGLDSGSMSMENLFLPFPMMRSSAITDAATGKDAVTELMYNLGGAPVSMLSRFGDAFILGSEGDFQKASEKVLPKFMSSLVKAERLGSEGLTTRSGNVAIEADEFDAWDQAIKALGFTPTKESEYYQAMYAKERVSQAIDDRRNRIIKAIATAKLNGEDTAEPLEQAREFNTEHPTRRITGESVTRSVSQRRKDKQQRSESGVRYEKRERDIRDVTRYAN